METRRDEEVEAEHPDRRRFLRGAVGALGVGVLATACTSDDDAGAANRASAPGGADSLLSQITESGTIRLGVDLTFPPLQFKDPADNSPTGYIIELARMLAADLQVEPEFVEVPFAQLFAAQAAGKFDMSGIAATILPSRAQNVLFASEPAFVESQVILLKPGLTISEVEELNDPERTIAVLLGSSQEASAPLLFPKAQIKSLDNQAAIQDVASGRSSATLLSEFNIVEALEQHPGITVFDAPPVFVDINTFFMPAGDFPMQAYVSNWLRYQTSHGVLDGLWAKYVGEDARAAGLPTVPVTSPYIRAF